MASPSFYPEKSSPKTSWVYRECDMTLVTTSKKLNADSSRSALNGDREQKENRKQCSPPRSSSSGPPPPGRGRSTSRLEGAQRLRNFPAMIVDPHIEEESPYTAFLMMELPEIDVNSLTGTQAGLAYNHIVKWERMLAWFKQRVELRIHAINVEAAKPTEIEPVFNVGGPQYLPFLQTVGPAIIGQPIVKPPPGISPPQLTIPKPLYLEYTMEPVMLPFPNSPQPGTSVSSSTSTSTADQAMPFIGMKPIGCINAPETKTETEPSTLKVQTKAEKKEGLHTETIFKQVRAQNANGRKSPKNLGGVYNPRKDERTPKKEDSNREGPEHRKPTKPIKLEPTILNPKPAPKPPTPPPMLREVLWKKMQVKIGNDTEMDITAQSEAKLDNELSNPGPSTSLSSTTEKPHLNSLGQDINASRPHTPEQIRENLKVRPEIPTDEVWDIDNGEVVDRRRANYRSVNFQYVKKIMDVNFAKVNAKLMEIETRLHREQIPDEADEGAPLPKAERALLTRQQEELSEAAMAITRVQEDPGSIEDAIEGLQQLTEMSRIHNFALEEHPQWVLTMLRAENLTIDEQRRYRNRLRRQRHQVHRRNADNVIYEDDGIEADYKSDPDDCGPGGAAPIFQLIGERLLDEAYQRREQSDNDDRQME